MLFLGDLSVPDKRHADLLINNMSEYALFKDETIIVNLEGVLLDEVPEDSFWKVYNCLDVLRLKGVCKRVAFGLANNHTYDFPEKISRMKQILDENQILYFGLSDGGAITPLEFESDGQLFAVFGHCWSIYTNANPNKKTADRIVDCSYEQYYRIVAKYATSHPGVKIICYPHWNFDLELYPFPAYKKLAKDLVDAGVTAVIGNHAHCMQECELYGGGVIAYGLGNFYMPSGVFFNGKLRFPDFSSRMCVLQLKEGNQPYSLFDFYTDSFDRAILYIGEREITEDCRTDHDYICFFKKNRRKKSFVPIFYDYKESFINSLKTEFIIARIQSVKFIKKLLKRGL